MESKKQTNKQRQTDLKKLLSVDEQNERIKFLLLALSLSILAASGTSSALSDHSVKRFTQLGLIIRKGK